MAPFQARSVLAALAVGAALLTATGCAGGSGSSAGTVDSSSALGPSSTPSGPAAATPGGAGSSAPASGPASSSAPATPSARPTGTGGASPGGTGSSGGASHAAGAWCTTGALSVSLTSGRPAAGNRYASLVLTNSSSAACRTQGWPGLQLTGEDGKPLPTTVVRDRSRTPKQLALAPGEQASARLHWTVVPGQDDPADGRCPEPSGLRVIPPDQRTADAAGWNLGTVCGAGRIEVLPLQQGGGPPQ